MANFKRNIYAFHTDPTELVGYEDHHEMIPTILFDKIRDIRSTESQVRLMKQYRDILGKDLDVAIRAAELYKNSESDNLWPVGGEVEMALLRSDKHRYEHLQRHIGSRLQQDPRYLDVLAQLDPVAVARYIGGHLVKQSYYVKPEFKEKVLEIINRDIAAGIIYSLSSTERNYKLEPILMRMSKDKWQDLVKNSPALEANKARYHDTAWEYYIKSLNYQAGRQARSDARADYGYET